MVIALSGMATAVVLARLPARVVIGSQALAVQTHGIVVKRSCIGTSGAVRTDDSRNQTGPFRASLGADADPNALPNAHRYSPRWSLVLWWRRAYVPCLKRPLPGGALCSIDDRDDR